MAFLYFILVVMRLGHLGQGGSRHGLAGEDRPRRERRHD